MKNLYISFVLIFLNFTLTGQDEARIKGVLQDQNNDPISYANVALYNAADASLFKVAISDENGAFEFFTNKTGSFDLKVSYVGFDEYQKSIELVPNQNVNLEVISLVESGVVAETAVITARRSLVEVKADRTVFNVQGTINSVGNNGLDLLRKAPGVLIDNNNNINVLGRAGVLVYVDGKRLPLAGDDLVGYLTNLTAEQIDRIDIISNPGAKYEAEGNAGIIDIRLKKNENHGANGSISADLTRAQLWRGGTNLNGNYRNGFMNMYGQMSYNNRSTVQTYNFDNLQNGVRIRNSNRVVNDDESGFLRLGADFFLSDKHTIGVLVSGNLSDRSAFSDNENFISAITSPDRVDSILIAQNQTFRDFNSQSVNLNYRYDHAGTSLNIDLDYGRYRTELEQFQPNDYFTPDGETLLFSEMAEFDTPTDIDIATFKLDYETDWMGGKLGLGSKVSRVATDNTFLFYDVINDERLRNDFKSNLFLYDEKVYAGYISFARPINKFWSFTSGLRVEQTDAMGDLQAFRPELQEPPVELNYLSWFPSAGLSFSKNPRYVYSANYSRRINRPDYNVLNPFRQQVNQLSFIRGNPFLQPEIVNNFELGFLYDYRFNFKLAYSRTIDQITRLIGTDDSDPRASFINWDNLATQTIYSLNISLPLQINPSWNAFFNLSGNYKDNQADYGEGVIVDVQAWSYNIYQQHTINLPKGFVGEVSGWYSGPGVWGGVFRYDSQWSLNLGLQKKFFDNKLNVKLSAQDIFHQAFWSGGSEFDGLTLEGQGEWDSRLVSLSMSYNFGNSKVKSRRRSTGLEAEAGRVGDGN